jgi:ribose transport system substrate-binding protein
MRRTLILASLFALALVGCSGGGGESASTTGATGGGAEAKLKIAVIPKGTQHVFWKSVQAGAEKAGEELGVEVIWKGPETEDDRDSQIKTVENFVTTKVDGICLAPLDDTALRTPVKAAQDAGIPVLIFDSALQDSDYVSFVATDNRAAGKMGGERLAKLLGGKGKVILLRYLEGSASTNEREEGFLDAMKENPGIEVISANQYAGATIETAMTASEKLINGNKDFFSGGVNGIFCPNESSAAGMLRALETSGFAGKVKFVGFDSSDTLVAGLEKGWIDALVVQNPIKMGDLAVRSMVAHLKKETVKKRIDTGAMVVDKENLSQPDVEALVKPKL